MRPRVSPAFPALLLAISLASPQAGALDDDQADALVRAARELLGVPYDLGGRLQKGRGTDCQGVLFYAAERVSGCGWRSFSVMPTTSVAREELGAPVPGLSPVATSALDVGELQKGDVLWFVGFAENPVEPAIGTLEGRRVWVWHTGLYAGEGHFVVGDHYAGKVTEEPLLPYLEAHAGSYAGVLVTRMQQGPTPPRCRRHAPMRRQS